ncbi:MAG: hypothetical protein AAFQ60_05745 [Pseudomonadota bacterium]
MTWWTFFKSVAVISGQFLGGSVLAFVAWAFWQIGVDEWGFMRLFSASFAIGAICCVGKGVWELSKLLIHDVFVANYHRKAAKPKADPKPGETTLRKNGLIR